MRLNLVGQLDEYAKMVCLDFDHPDIEEFINWKVIEERKVKALVTGLKNL